MNRTTWKSLAAATAVAAFALVLPQMALADWPTYNAYPITGIDNLPDAAYAINSYLAIAGSANYDTNQNDYTALLGGIGQSSSTYNLPPHWNTFQMTGLNNSGSAVGTAWNVGHPTALYYKPGGQALNMQAGLTYTYQSTAAGINQAGIAVGSYHREDPDGLHFHMFRWDPATQSRTGDWENLVAGGINENGTMVASNLVPTNYWKIPELAFVTANGAISYAMGPGASTYLQPNAISTNGGVTVACDVMTYIQNASNTYYWSSTYNKQTGVWSVLPGIQNQYFETHGLGVDYGGTRVAGYTVDAGGNQIATVWEFKSGAWVSTDVGSLVNDPLWKFQQATSINPQGAICGFGMHKVGRLWHQQAFVLQPNNELILGPVDGAILGGMIVHPVVHISGIDPSVLNLGLSCDSDFASVAPSVQLPANQSAVAFPMQTNGVDSMKTVVVTATLGGFKTMARYQIRPAILGYLTCKSADYQASGLVALQGAAGPSGVVVTLASSNPAITPPATVTIPYKQSSATFKMNVAAGTPKGTTTTITATYKSVTVTFPLTLD